MVILDLADLAFFRLPRPPRAWRRDHLKTTCKWGDHKGSIDTEGVTCWAVDVVGVVTWREIEQMFNADYFVLARQYPMTHARIPNAVK